MGLGMWLLEKTIDKAAPAVFLGATAATAAAVGGAVGVAESVADRKAKAREKEKRELEAKAKQEAQSIREELTTKANTEKQPVVAKVNYTEYDIRLVCAKVAICGYIVYADNQLSESESNYINNLFGTVLNEYGSEIYDRAVLAYQNSARSFMNLQDYLRKVNLKDIKVYLQAADEVAEIDGVDESELRAIQRIKDYIEQQETGPVQYLVCRSCSGMMSIDDYGYKAICTSCGREAIIDSSNAPASAYREMNKPVSANENKPVEKEPVKEVVKDDTPVPDKSRKGKIALKVAVGVMTGGVSLIPDAVSAVSKKSKGK